MVLISLDVMVPEHRLARVADRAVVSTDLGLLFARYPGNGTSASNLAMVLTVIIVN